MKDSPQAKESHQSKKKEHSAAKVKKKSTPDPKQRNLISFLGSVQKSKPKSLVIVTSDSDSDEPLSKLKAATSPKSTQKILSPPVSPVLHPKSPKDKLKTLVPVDLKHGVCFERSEHTHTSKKSPTLGCLKEFSSCKVLVNGIGNLVGKKSPVSPKGIKSPNAKIQKKPQKVTSPTASPGEKGKTSPKDIPLVISPKRVTEKDSTAAADIFSWKIPRKRKSDESISPEGTAKVAKESLVCENVKSFSPVKCVSSSHSNKDKDQKLKGDIVKKGKILTGKFQNQKNEKKDSKKRSSKQGQHDIGQKHKKHDGHDGGSPKRKKAHNTSKEKKSSSPSKSDKSKKHKSLESPSKKNVARSIDFSSDDSESDLPLAKLKVSSPKIKISERKDGKSPKIKVTKKRSMKQKSLLDFARKRGSSKKKSHVVSLHDRFVKASSPKKTSKAEKKSLKKPLTEEEKKERNRQRMLLKKELNKKVDDHEIKDATSLPTATPVNLPPDLSAESFGDILMLTEFLHTFSKLLMPEESFIVTAESLAGALGSGKDGFKIVSKLLLQFLRILCSEEDEEVEGLGISIADMPLTTYTVSELLRYYLEIREKGKTKTEGNENTDATKVENTELKTEDADDDFSSIGSTDVNKEQFTDNVPKRIQLQLREDEFFMLSAGDKLKVLVFLFNDILDSADFSDYLASIQLQSKEVWREQDLLRKKKAKERKEQAAKEEENKAKVDAAQVGAIDKFVTKLDLKAEQGKEHKSTGHAAKADEKEAEQALNNNDGVKAGGNVEKNVKEETVKEEQVDDTKEQREKKELKEAKESKEPKDIKEQNEIKECKDKKDKKEEEVTSDLVMVVKQRRLLSAQQQAMKEEVERKDKERRAKLEEEYHEQRKMQSWRETIEKCKKSMRLDPLGIDRDYKMYWVLTGGSPFLYVEDGWMHHESEQKQINSWTFYSTVEEIDNLLKCLNERGIRESSLKLALQTHYQSLSNKIKKRLPDNTEIAPAVEDDTLKAFCADMIESATRSVKGNLGNIPDLETWQENVNSTTKVEELASFVLELQNSIFPKNFQGFLSTSSDKSRFDFWRKSVEEAKTMSALHLLLGLLENSVSWDRSAENAKCKVCRRKGDEHLILCDVCNYAYHGYCLRPALDYIPPEGWKCPACQPNAPRRRKCILPDLKDEDIDLDAEEEEEEEENESGDDSDEEEEEESGSDDGTDHESYCHVCGEGGEMICCDTCPLVFHLECHDPPLRRLPRGTWSCCECRNPKRSTRSQNQSKGKQATKAQSKPRKRGRRARVTYHSSSDDKGSSSEEQEDEEEETRKRKATRRRKAVQKIDSGASSSESEEEQDESDSPRGRRGGRPRQRAAQPAKRGRGRMVKEEMEEEKAGKAKTLSSKRKGRSIVSSDESTPTGNVSGRKRRKTSERGDNSDKVTSPTASLGADRRESTSGRHRRGNNYEITACENIMAKLWAYDYSWPFKAPVNLKQVHDYLDYVETPMDLWTIKEKLNRLEYEDAFHFIDDVRLVLKNSRSYNSETSEVGQAGIRVEEYFQELLTTYLPGIASSLNGDEEKA